MKGTANIHRGYGLRKGFPEEMAHELKLKKIRASKKTEEEGGRTS